MTQPEENALLDVLDALEGCGHGVTIRQRLSEELGRDVNFGELYTTLNAMEQFGIVRSAEGKATPERGGRRKRHFWRA